MLRFFINDFFKMIKSPTHKLSFDSLSKVIQNETLVNELINRNKFQDAWREKLGYKLSNEKYKILKLTIIKDNDIIKVCVKVAHKFKFSNYPNKIESSETQDYVFIIKKSSKGNIILDLCNKELNPTLYDKLLAIDSNYFNKNSQSRSLKERSRIEYFENLYKNIDKLAMEFHKSFTLYRSNYNDSPRGTYNPLAAVRYARKYALNYNPEYNSYGGIGGDCTNYISQCIKAGGIRTTNVWKPYSHPWIRVNELYYYLLRNGNGVDITKNKSYPIGSIIQFFSNKKGYYSHSGIITESLANGDYLYCCHSYDKLDFPLSEIYPLFYDKFRIVNPI